MNKFVKFFHELLNPHCEHCIQQMELAREVEREMRRCDSCESLRMQIALLNKQNETLINKLTSSNEVAMPQTNETAPKPIKRGGQIPFGLVRKALESESRARAEALRRAAQPDSQVQNNEVSNENRPSETQAQTEDVNKLEDLVFNAQLNREAQVGSKQ